MPNTDFSEIERLHSEWLRMDNVARLAYLNGQWDSLNQMAYQYGMYLKNRTSITQTERQYAQYLVDMINSVDAEGTKVMNDLRNETFKEIVKRLTFNNLTGNG